MTPKQNAMEIIRFGSPDRVQTDYPQHSVAYRGCNHESYTDGSHHLPVGTRWTDIWGTGWRRSHEGVMGFPKGHPLADLPRAIRTYNWPDPDDERICGWIHERAESWNPDDTFLYGPHRDTLWEKSYMLVGMEDLMCYMVTEPAAVRELFHRIMDFQLGIARHYLDVGVEMVGLGDDLGTQEGPLFSPEMLEGFLVPEYSRLFDLYKQNDVLIRFHSCGNIAHAVDYFIDLGVDILNPIQATANDLDALRAKTQGRMALEGGVRSGLMVSGPVEEIRAEAARRIWQLGRSGGYFCFADQSMPWPDESADALRRAVDEFGTYPVTEPGLPESRGSVTPERQ